MAEDQEVYDGVDRRHRNGSTSSEQFVVVKSWHTVLILITLIAGIILSYGSVKDQTDENTRRIRDLETRPQVSQQSVDELNRRLERLEQRFDTQDLRDWRQLGDPRKH